MNNTKKEFPKNGLEEDCTSKFGRQFLCYVNNIKGLKKFVKRQMSKRFRRSNDKLIQDELKDGTTSKEKMD